MDTEGYRRIAEAVHDLHAQVLVPPNEGEHLEYVTVVWEGHPAAAIYNALGAAGLLAENQSGARMPASGPQLTTEIGVPGNITFRDRYNGH
jgi:hypothetical protein